MLVNSMWLMYCITPCVSIGIGTGTWTSVTHPGVRHKFSFELAYKTAHCPFFRNKISFKNLFVFCVVLLSNNCVYNYSVCH